MKKSLVIAALGLTAAVGSSYGQGYILFSSYAQTATPYATATIFGTSTLLDSSFKAQLWYSLGTVSDTVNNGSVASITSAPTGLTVVSGSDTVFATSGASTPGFFDGAITQIASYSSGPITFEVVAFNGADYASSSVRGRSGSFTFSSIDTVGIGTKFGFNGGQMSPMFVAPVPEPSTLALAGLGGFGMLMAFRRKKA